MDARRNASTPCSTTCKYLVEIARDIDLMFAQIPPITIPVVLVRLSPLPIFVPRFLVQWPTYFDITLPFPFLFDIFCQLSHRRRAPGQQSIDRPIRYETHLQPFHQA